MPSFSSSSNQITERQRVQSLILLLPYLKSTDYARLVVCSHSARSAVSVHLRKAIYTFPSLSDSFQTSLDYWCHLWFFFLKTLNLRALDRKKELGLNVLPTDATVATLCAVLRRLDHSMIGQVDLFSPLKPSNLSFEADSVVHRLLSRAEFIQEIEKRRCRDPVDDPLFGFSQTQMDPTFPLAAFYQFLRSLSRLDKPPSNMTGEPGIIFLKSELLAFCGTEAYHRVWITLRFLWYGELLCFTLTDQFAAEVALSDPPLATADDPKCPVAGWWEYELTER